MAVVPDAIIYAGFYAQINRTLTTVRIVRIILTKSKMRFTKRKAFVNKKTYQ